jgi:uncharacterized protein (DUF4415 family)
MLEVMKDSEIDYSDIPATDKEFWKNAKVVKPQHKKTILLQVDKEILEWFKSQGKSYQSRINAVLKAYVETQRKKTKTAKINQ